MCDGIFGTQSIGHWLLGDGQINSIEVLFQKPRSDLLCSKDRIWIVSLAMKIAGTYLLMYPPNVASGCCSCFLFRFKSTPDDYIHQLGSIVTCPKVEYASMYLGTSLFIDAIEVKAENDKTTFCTQF